MLDIKSVEIEDKEIEEVQRQINKLTSIQPEDEDVPKDEIKLPMSPDPQTLSETASSQNVCASQNQIKEIDSQLD